MKLRKVLSSVVAGAIAVSAMAISASATLKVMPQDGHFFSGTGSWMPLLYSDGTVDVADGKEATDYGLDLSAIGSIEVTLTPDDPEWFDGSFGGGIILSSAKTDHNWNSKNFWGVVDEELEIDSLDTSAPVQFVKVGPYTYKGVATVDDSNNVPEGTHLVQLAVQEWGQNMCDMVIVSVVVKDKDGNEMIAFDGNGKANIPMLDGSAPAEDETADDEAEADDTAEAADDDDDDAAAADDDDDTAADVDEADDDDDAAAADDDDDDDDTVAADDTNDAPVAAPAATEAVVTTAAQTQAPAAGDVAAATTSTKGSPDTGVADVAAVAGLAIVAAGAVLVAKKRK